MLITQNYARYGENIKTFEISDTNPVENSCVLLCNKQRLKFVDSDNK